MAPAGSCRSIDLSEQFDQCYPKIFRYFRYRGADIDTANDLASAVFERALARLESYNPRKAAFNTWLFAIARNVAIDAWKTQSRLQSVSLDTATSLPSNNLPQDEAVAVQEQNQALLTALNNLGEREREIVALKFAGALKNSQIAKMTGLSANHVGVVLYRALHQLKEKLSEAEEQVRDE